MLIKALGLVAVFVVFLVHGYSFVHSGEALVREIKKVVALIKSDDSEHGGSDE